MNEPARDMRRTALDYVQGQNLKGRTAMVTGGAAGIGLEITRALATAGAHVCIATRDVAKAEEAASLIRSETKNNAVEVMQLDLGVLASVRLCVQNFLGKKIALDFLFCNAGIMAVPFSLTPDGFESQFAINYLGHLALVQGLLPALKAASNARVVTTTSIAHRRSDIHYDDIHFAKRPYDAWSAYGQSNTATALLSVGITQKFASYGITANTVMPGGVMTGLQKYVPRDKQIELGWIDDTGGLNPVFKTPQQGAATSVWAALAPELKGQGGLYLQNCTVAEPWTSEEPLLGYMPYAVDTMNAERLWALSEKLIARVR